MCLQGNANGNKEAPQHTCQNPDMDNTPGWRAGGNRHSHPLLAGRQVAAATSKASLADSYKTELTLTGPAIMLPGLRPKELQSYVLRTLAQEGLSAVTEVAWMAFIEGRSDVHTGIVLTKPEGSVCYS